MHVATPTYASSVIRGLSGDAARARLARAPDAAQVSTPIAEIFGRPSIVPRSTTLRITEDPAAEATPTHADAAASDGSTDPALRQSSSASGLRDLAESHSGDQITPRNSGGGMVGGCLCTCPALPSLLLHGHRFCEKGGLLQ